MLFKRFIFICFAVLVPAFLGAQTAAEIESLLGTQRLAYGPIARIVLQAADEAVFASPGEAFAYALEQGWLPKKTAASGAARLDAVSLLLMRAFGMEGGIFYSVFQNPHYAYRELSGKKIIQGRASPEMPVSGEKLLFMLGRCLAIAEERIGRWESLAAEINVQLKELKVDDSSAEVTRDGVRIRLSNIQFRADSAELAASEFSKLDRIVSILQKVKQQKLLVSGHTALAGTAEGQRNISLERARAVAGYLVKSGARKTNEISVQGFGASRPIADNGTPEGMARNRRVEITILEEK